MARDGFPRFVGVRFLTSRNRSSVLSMISALSVLGVAVGVMAMVIILSVMSGFEMEMKNRLFQAEHHILIEDVRGTVAVDESVMTKARQAYPGIRELEPVLQVEAVYRSGKRIAGGVVKGVKGPAWERVRRKVTDWAAEGFVKTGQARLLMGAEMAFELGVAVGDTITLVSPVDSDGPLGMAPRLKTFVVEGIYKSGVPEQELHVGFAPVEDVESFVRKAGVATHYEGLVGSLEDAPEAAERVAAKLGPGYRVRSWQQLNEHLFASLSLERAAMFCMVGFIVLVAAFNILSMLAMTVLEKKRGVSILRAMGATPEQVRRIFLWESLAIGATGAGLGAALGLGVCILLKKYPLIELPEYYYDRTLPVLIEPMTIAGIVFTALLVVVLGGIVPARKAMAVSPLEGIQEG
jgi:lipoprotein-releasing system permease protein